MSARIIHLEPKDDYLGHYLTACGVKTVGPEEDVPEYAVTDDPFAATCGNCKRTHDYQKALTEEAEFALEQSRCAEWDPGAIG